MSSEYPRLMQPQGCYVQEAKDKLEAEGFEDATWPQIHARAWKLQKLDAEYDGTLINPSTDYCPSCKEFKPTVPNGLCSSCREFL